MIYNIYYFMFVFKAFFLFFSSNFNFFFKYVKKLLIFLLQFHNNLQHCLQEFQIFG